MHHISFIHSSVDSHLNWFHFLAIISNAAVNMEVPVSCGRISSPLGICPGHMVDLFLVEDEYNLNLYRVRMLKLISTMGRHVCSLTFSVSPIQCCRHQNPARKGGRETEEPGEEGENASIQLPSPTATAGLTWEGESPP